MKNATTAAPRRLLFVDDESRILDSVRRSLRGVDPSWELLFAGSVDEACDRLRCDAIDLVVTDLNMPHRDGFSLLSFIASTPQLQNIPVVVLTGRADTQLKARALDAGAVDLLSKPIRREELVARIHSVLRTKSYQDLLTDLNVKLEQLVVNRTRDLDASRTDILLCLAMAGECRDADTGRHLIRVAQYARLLAAAMHLPPGQIDLIFKATPLHDIGKLGVPDHLLLKPGALTQQERLIMQRHCEIGNRILSTPKALAAAFDDSFNPDERPVNPLLAQAASIALTHHERWDGSGYPRRLKGQDIPIAGRLVAVADVYDALTTRRPYKKAFDHSTAVSTIAEGSGTQFDPAVVSAFLEAQDRFDDIRGQWADADEANVNTLSAVGELMCGKRSA